MTIDDSERTITVCLFMVGIVFILLGFLPGSGNIVYFITGIIMIALGLMVIIIDIITKIRKKSMEPKRITSQSLSSRRESRDLRRISSRSSSSRVKHSYTPSISQSFPVDLDSLPESATEEPSPSLIYKCSSCGRKIKKPPYFCDYCGQAYCSKHISYTKHTCWGGLKDLEQEDPGSVEIEAEEEAYELKNTQPVSGESIYNCRICRKKVSKAPYFCDYCGLPYCSKHRSYKIHNCWGAPKDPEGPPDKRGHDTPRSKESAIPKGKCAACGIEVSWPNICKRCGKPFCTNHRLPESHYCEKIHTIRKTPLPRPKSNECSFCGIKTIYTFYCEPCGKSFCTPHRLPEDHNCEKIQRIRRVELEATRKNHCQICEKEISSPFACQYCYKRFCYEHIPLQIHNCPKEQSSPKKLLPIYVTEKTEYNRFCFNCGMLVKAGEKCEVCIATGIEEDKMHEIEEWARRGLDIHRIYG